MPRHPIGNVPPSRPESVAIVANGTGASVGASAAALALLCLGLLPVWALSLQTPFRLIDDYGAVFVVRRLGVGGFLRDNFSLAVNPARFRPTHDLGQLVAWGLFADHPAPHHLMRLLMKMAAFAALLAVALRAVEQAAGRRPSTGHHLALLPLAVSLFFYFPNNPEARLAPQELATVLYFMGALFFLGHRSRVVSLGLADVLCFVCFALALWAKEPNFIAATPLLAAIAREGARRPGGAARRLAWVLAHLALWLHAALKAAVMNGAGYARAPLSRVAVEAMLRQLPRQLLLSASGDWVPLVFVTGVTLFAAWGLRRAPEGPLRAGLPLWMLLASLAQWALMWGPVLRYAAPTAAFLILVTIAGFGLLLARASTERALARRALALAAVALLFAATNYRDLAAQYAVQYVAGRTEEAVLAAVDDWMSAEPSRALHVASVSEYEYRLGVYFNQHRPFFTGRKASVVPVRRPDQVPAGGYLIGRQLLEGFEPLRRFDPAAPPPRIVAEAASVTRAARLGAALPPVMLDAGAEPPSPWFVSRRRE
jgi:hypothetical protein